MNGTERRSLTDVRHSGTLVYMDRDQLSSDTLAAALANETIGHTVQLHGSVPSTMPLAKSLADDSMVRSGAVVIAEEQTAGRGRLARSWDAPYGQALLMTVVLKPPALPTQPTHLPMAASLAIVDAVLDIAPALSERMAIKWPNDILINSRMNRDDAPAWRKVAGILIETSYTGSALTYALIGMGINVSQDLTTLPSTRRGGLAATSICQHLSAPVDRTTLAIAVCKRLGHWLSVANVDGGDRLFQAWRSHLLTIGQNVTVHDINGVEIVEGVIEDVDPAGQLIVCDDAGEHHTVDAGDVSLYF